MILKTHRSLLLILANSKKTISTDNTLRAKTFDEKVIPAPELRQNYPASMAIKLLFKYFQSRLNLDWTWVIF